jgi:integrase
MALVKKCAHGRGKSGPARVRAWQRCGCQWVADLRTDGRRVYRPLGTDYRSALEIHDRLAGLPNGSPEGRTFASVAERWERVAEQRVARSTMHGYRASLRHVLAWMGPAVVDDVTAADLAEMEADLVTGTGLSPLYARNARNVAIAVLGHAHEAGLIKSIPRGRRRRTGTRTRNQRRFLSRDELARVWATGHRSIPLFQFAAMTGMRAGELLALERDDIDDRKNVARVRRGFDRFGQIGPLKSKAGRRDVDLPAEALAILPPGSGRLWPMHYSSALDHWHAATDAAGLARCGLHVLRHTNASMRIALGQDLVYIADQLGHSDPAITLREYGHLIERERRDASGLAIMLHAGDPSAAAAAPAASEAPRRQPARRRAAGAG